MEMEEEVDVLSQQEEMPPAVSAVLDSTTELKKGFFSPSFTLMHLPSRSFIHTSLCVLFFAFIFALFMKYTLK